MLMLEYNYPTGLIHKFEKKRQNTRGRNIGEGKTVKTDEDIKLNKNTAELRGRQTELGEEQFPIQFSLRHLKSLTKDDSIITSHPGGR